MFTGSLEKFGLTGLRNGHDTQKHEGRLVGYARVSTEDQSPKMQIDALLKAGVAEDMIYSECVSGVKQRRRQLELAIKCCSPGDTLVVWKLDRLGRSLPDLLKRLADLEENGVGFRSLTEGIDTTTPGGRLIMHVMASLAQFESDLIAERTRTGVRAHIARGGKIGAERKMTEDKIKEALRMFKNGASAREVAKRFSVQPATVYNYFPGGPEKYRKT